MNISTKNLATRLEEWAAEVLNINTYPEQPDYLGKALPLVLCEVQNDRRGERDPDLPNLGPYQQASVRARRAELLLLVDPEPSSWTASQTLYDYVDALGEALKKDDSLGQRVHVASKFYEADYTPPQIQHADGTVARAARFRITVGELVEV